MTQKKGFLTVLGFDPAGSVPCEFKVALKQVQHLQTLGPTHKFYELISACEVLKSPLAVFEGLQRDGQEKGLCYIGKPRCHGDGVQYPPHPNMVFLVCVTGEKTIFEWGWEREDSARPGLPVNSKQRFGKIKWKHSSTT